MLIWYMITNKSGDEVDDFELSKFSLDKALNGVK